MLRVFQIESGGFERAFFNRRMAVVSLLFSLLDPNSVSLKTTYSRPGTDPASKLVSSSTLYLDTNLFGIIPGAGLAVC